MSGFAMPAPCVECPWRKDVTPGKFPPERYIALAPTCTPGGVPAIFGCHMTPPDQTRACAGMLAVCGLDNNRVRLAVGAGAWRPSDAVPTEPLYESYAALAVANGVDPGHPSLAAMRERYP